MDGVNGIFGIHGTLNRLSEFIESELILFDERCKRVIPSNTPIASNVAALTNELVVNESCSLESKSLFADVSFAVKLK